MYPVYNQYTVGVSTCGVHVPVSGERCARQGSHGSSQLPATATAIYILRKLAKGRSRELELPRKPSVRMLGGALDPVALKPLLRRAQ